MGCSTQYKEQPHLIPQPQKISINDGWCRFDGYTIVADKGLDRQKINLKKLLEDKGIYKQKNIRIVLSYSDVKNPLKYEGAYRIDISDSIVIKSKDDAGFFYAFKTLNQMMIKCRNDYKIAKSVVEDWPAFKIRGFMQDVGRNYQSINLLKEQIDVLADYKMNYFHFHVTDNPGWRLESKIYPQLQSKKATSRKYGKHYTQEEFKELIMYCKDRHITLIPEFDIPGHTKAFREAFGFKGMKNPDVEEILVNLIDELCSIVPIEEMPYIHLGTDEARHESEKINKEVLQRIFDHVKTRGRRVISWRPGIVLKGDSLSVKQLWTGDSKPLTGHAFIDSRANYINHLDPLAGMFRLFYQQPCGKQSGNANALGGVLCCWHDNYIENERDILRQNPIYPSIVTYSEAVWSGKTDRDGRKYWCKLPNDSNSEYYKDFVNFENKLLWHRNNYFKGKEFQYVKNSHIPWRIIGPFNHGGNTNLNYNVEKNIKKSYSLNGKIYQWSDSVLYGGTIHLKHFFGFPSPVKQNEGTVYAFTKIHSDKEKDVDFWVGFHGWSRSGGRRGGPAPSQGEWHHTNSKVWINNLEVNPPEWKQPELAVKTTEIPFVDEDYFYRKPTKIRLNKGWNTVLLKVPFTKQSFKWMYTFVPVKITNEGIREVEGLKFSVDI